MMNRIEKFADTLKAESRVLADRAVHGLRTAGLETAELLTRTKRPVHAIADTGIKLNNLSHKSIDQLLKQQVAVLDDIIDGGAQRLEKAARARTVRTLIDGQFAALPKTRDHAVKNARKTVTNAKKTAARALDTGDAIGDLFMDVVVDIASARKPAPKRARPAAKKAAARKPAARKASAKKAPAKKAAAKKRTARKATATQSQAA